MDVQSWILVIIGIGTTFIGWIGITVVQIKFAGIKFSTSIEKDLKAFADKMEEVIEAIVDIPKHERDIKDINSKIDLQRKSIKATERFLGAKYGAEYLEVYEKAQDSIS